MTEAKQESPVEKDSKNGVTRPRPGSRTGIVWELCDSIYTETGETDRKRLLEMAAARGVCAATVSTQYGRWRKYMGLVDPDRSAATVARLQNREQEGDDEQPDDVPPAAVPVE